MPACAVARSLRPDLPLKFVGGDPSLDLVNTVDWTPSGPAHDRLGSYERLVTWALGAGVLSEKQAQGLRHRAERRSRDAKAAYESARWARWVLHEVFCGIVTRRSLAKPLTQFNALLSRAHGHLHVAPPPAGRRPAGPALTWEWGSLPTELESVLWPVVRSAATLLTSREAASVRICAGPDCGWLYVDRSRNGFRRWCEMETCGTLAKSRRRAERRHLRSLRAPGRRKR